MEACSPPDPGFNQKEYCESEIEEDIANLDESCEDASPPRNPFIDDEAEEADAEEEPPQGDEESDPNNCVVVAQLTEDEANATEYSDFDNLFSRAKRRRMETVSDSE